MIHCVQLIRREYAALCMMEFLLVCMPRHQDTVRGLVDLQLARVQVGGAPNALEQKIEPMRRDKYPVRLAYKLRPLSIFLLCCVFFPFCVKLCSQVRTPRVRPLMRAVESISEAQ